MNREYRILHHRQSLQGGHWDMVENPIPFRSAAANVAHGEGSLCAALQHVATEGWVPIMDLYHAQAQAGESFILLVRDIR